ncbi:MAG: magnesium transporter [Sandaracinaceae bacterium]|nr:magnesium transporter [Sandaracinaceae bacterium]
MRLANLLGPDLEDALKTDPDALHDALEEFHPEDIAEIVEDLSLELTLELFTKLPDEFSADVLTCLPSELQTEILERLSRRDAAEILSEMDPDDLVDVVQELREEDEKLADDLLAHLEQADPEIAEDVRELSAYPEDVAGGLMTTDYVALSPERKVWQAIEEVRRLALEDGVETVYYVYVVYSEKLVGVVSMRDLILSESDQELGDIMSENIVSVRDTDDQEVVAHTIAKYDFMALPVIDEQGNLRGVVTVDDVVDVVIEEATEDAHKMGAVEALEEGYFETDLVQMFRSRVFWLSLLFVGGFLTTTVMERFSGQLSAAVTLAVFVPLIISSGGNSGSQSAALIIRALAVGDVEPRDWLRVLGREVVVSLSLGLVLGVLGFARAYFAGGPDDDPILLGVAVSLSTVGVVMTGSLFGSLLPLGIQRVGLDPAVSSTPFIASLVDVIGLLIYLSIAGAVLGVG